jgi:hypothetical protein
MTLRKSCFGQRPGACGHAPATQGGQFTLHKFGNLILHAANGKSGMAEIRRAARMSQERNRHP